MLEEKIEALTAALNANTAAIKGLKGGAAASTAAPEKAKPGRPPAAKSKFTAEQVKAAVVNVKDTIDADTAKGIISEAGAKDLADLLTKKEAFDGVMEACEAALAAQGEEAADESDGL